MRNQSSSNHPQKIGVGTAILLGQLLVNVPVLIIIFGFMIASLFFTESMLWVVIMIIGFVLAWIWWSFTVPRWRRWALKQAVPADKLQKWAVSSGLTWPKDSIFEKTEFKLKDEE